MQKLFFLYCICILFFLFFNKEIGARLPTEVDGGGPRDYWQFIFLFDTTKAAGQREYNLHPFYSQYSNDERAYNYYSFLYPLFYMHGTNYWKRWSWFHLFSGDDFYHKDTGKDSDLVLGPLAIGSGKQEEDSYLALFPICCKIKDLFGYDEVDFFLFPLYSGWSYKDYKAHSLIWPLTVYGKSKTRTKHRFLPFYSYNAKKNWYKRVSVLWPFFQWGSEALNKKEPRHYFFSFPLFGYKWSDEDTLFSWTFLWLPFLGGLVSYGRDTIKKEVDYNFLFFLFQHHRSEDPGIHRTLIFPFYFYYRYGQMEEEYDPYYKEARFITPLYGNLRTYSSIVDTDYDYFLPIYWNMKRYYHKEREEESYLKIWPFFQYVKNSEGALEFRSLVLWPWRSDQFEKNWGTYYSLLQYQEHENGDRYFSLLLRLYSQYWNDNESHYFLAGLEWHNTPEHWSFEILGGLLGVHRYTMADGEGDWAFEFLWFDISRPEEIDSL